MLLGAEYGDFAQRLEPGSRSRGNARSRRRRERQSGADALIPRCVRCAVAHYHHPRPQCPAATMGASQSRAESDDQVFRVETPIQVSPHSLLRPKCLHAHQKLSHLYTYQPYARPNTDVANWEFSDDVVNELVDTSAAPAPSAERQSTIDAQIRSRIQVELQHLHQEEEVVRLEIERELEKENLDRERAMAGHEGAAAASEEGGEVEAGEAGEAGNVRSSAALMGDLEEVRQKVERFQTRRALAEFPDVQSKSEAVVNCYKCVVRFSLCASDVHIRARSHPATSLDCYREVVEFKSSVARVEQVCISSVYAGRVPADLKTCSIT